MTDVNWTYCVIILQYIQISSHYTVHLKLLYLKTNNCIFLKNEAIYKTDNIFLDKFSHT